MPHVLFPTFAQLLVRFNNIIHYIRLILIIHFKILIDEPRVAILENDGVKTLSKALSRPELFTYALEISKSLALCSKQ